MQKCKISQYKCRVKNEVQRVILNMSTSVPGGRFFVPNQGVLTAEHLKSEVSFLCVYTSKDAEEFNQEDP